MGALHVPASRPVPCRRLHADSRRESLSASPAMGHEPGARVVHMTSLERCVRSLQEKSQLRQSDVLQVRVTCSEGLRRREEDLGGILFRSDRRSRAGLRGIVGSAVSAAVARHGHTRAPLDVAHLGDSAARPASGRQEHHLIAHAHPVGWTGSLEIRFLENITKYDRRFHQVRSSGMAPARRLRSSNLKPEGFPGHPPCTRRRRCAGCARRAKRPAGNRRRPFRPCGRDPGRTSRKSFTRIPGSRLSACSDPGSSSAASRPPLCVSAPRCSGWADSPARSSRIS